MEEREILRRLIITSALVLACGPASADCEVVYQRLWPALQQPWNFASPEGLDIDPDGNVYVADTDNHRALQMDLPGAVVVIYDASRSGSFTPGLASSPGQTRVVITSTNGAQPAFLLNQGALSFSNLFWVQVFNGLNLFQAYSSARSVLADQVEFQQPQLDDNGNGVPNEPADGPVADSLILFNQNTSFDLPPVLEGVSPPRTIGLDQFAAEFFVETALDDGPAVSRVLGVVTPPQTKQTGDDVVTDLPVFELLPVGDGRFEGTFDGFDLAGLYTIDLYARDNALNLSEPRRTTIDKGGLLPDTLVISVFNGQTNQPIEGARVTIQGFDPGPFQTSEAGLVVIPNMPEGLWTITVRAEGFPDQSRDVSVTGGAIRNVRFTFEPQTRPGPSCFGAGARDGAAGSGAVLIAAVLALCVLGRKRRAAR
jgi:hypothetical protein